MKSSCLNLFARAPSSPERTTATGNSTGHHRKYLSEAGINVAACRGQRGTSVLRVSMLMKGLLVCSLREARPRTVTLLASL